MTNANEAKECECGACGRDAGPTPERWGGWDSDIAGTPVCVMCWNECTTGPEVPTDGECAGGSTNAGNLAVIRRIRSRRSAQAAAEQGPRYCGTRYCDIHSVPIEHGICPAYTAAAGRSIETSAEPVAIGRGGEELRVGDRAEDVESGIECTIVALIGERVRVRWVYGNGKTEGVWRASEFRRLPPLAAKTPGGSADAAKGNSAETAPSGSGLRTTAQPPGPPPPWADYPENPAYAIAAPPEPKPVPRNHSLEPFQGFVDREIVVKLPCGVNVVTDTCEEGYLAVASADGRELWLRDEPVTLRCYDACDLDVADAERFLDRIASALMARASRGKAVGR